jgi:2-octaprenyl-6-methoxyphenol hydroxylase
MGKNRLNLIFLHRLWRKGRSVPGIIVEPAPWELDSGAPVNETASASRAMPRRDVAVVGAGPVGLAAALALAHVGADVVLIGPVPPKLDAGPQDTRTAALLASSVDLLKALGVWQAVAPHAAPLKTMRIVDASQSLFRSPEIVFEAAELGLEAFGYNIPNAVLVEALYARAKATLGTIIPASVTRVAFEHAGAVLVCDDGTEVAVRLVVAADGRRSICREAAGINTRAWRYDQSAIATSFHHTLPHDGISTELHREGGSVTTVPLPDPHASSLIWVGSSAEIAQLMQLDDEAFAEMLAERLGGVVGRISDIGARAAFPVEGLSAETLGARRTALVGEAAHILPPIGAQGLNLGLRDAAELADCVAEARGRGADAGEDEMLTAYARARSLDVLSRTIGVDLLNRSLLTGFAPVQAVRGAILHGLNALPFLRRAVMRVGLEPPTDLPSLMRPAT